MGIPHPQSHIAQCLAIKQCWANIKEHCAKPSHPVSRIFVRRTGNRRLFEMNYKGAERFEIEEQEIGFLTGANHVVHADISSCFPSIYTHSIPWAIHGRQKAKQERNNLSLWGNILDRATQGVSDGQTNGLLIGPHTSNVISEIVLTKIDAILLKKDYERLSRHIDDYSYYAKTYEEAEEFIRQLSMTLREFELFLNEGKTKILPLPKPQFGNWIRELNTFQFPTEEIDFSTVRRFLDLALHLAQEVGTSAVLNYAIKMIPPRLNNRAKRLFVRESINLSLSYPYLAPLLEDHIFAKHEYEGIEAAITIFTQELVKIGIERIYPDAIAYSLYYAIKYNIKFSLPESGLKKIVSIDDCICHVLLFEYATLWELSTLREEIQKRANNLKKLDSIDQDPFWLLIYQVWPVPDLQKNHSLLAELKAKKFSFIRFQS
ncbi:MAG: RNA-directed DNA polymerase [Desulfurellaceae bacterium]|nr:RNA-directed DNA polymerase [Desulfurellaceae bacterium]